MPSSDQPSLAAVPRLSQNIEPVDAAFLAAAVRPAILAARPAVLLAAHDAVAGHLRRYLTGDLSHHDAGTADQSFLRPALRLRWQADQAVAATLVFALSTTHHASGPASPASPQLLRCALLDLAASIDTLLADADAATSAPTTGNLPDDVPAISLAVISAASLHRHAARGQALHLLYHLWQHLQPDPSPASLPPPPISRPRDTAQLTIPAHGLVVH
jgi:hypothetical protein